MAGVFDIDLDQPEENVTDDELVDGVCNRLPASHLPHRRDLATGLPADRCSIVTNTVR